MKARKPKPERPDVVAALDALQTGDQMRLPFARQRRAQVVDTKAKRARDKLERTRYDALLEAMRAHPAIERAWYSTPVLGTLTPAGGGPQRFVRSGTKGLPDLTGFTTHGRTVFLEVKVERGETTPEQEAFLALAKACGCVTGVVHDEHELVALLDRKTSPTETKRWVKWILGKRAHSASSSETGCGKPRPYPAGQ